MDPPGDCLGFLTILPLAVAVSLVQQYVLMPLGGWGGSPGFRDGPALSVAFVVLSALAIGLAFVWLNRRNRAAPRAYGRAFWLICPALLYLPSLIAGLWPLFFRSVVY